MSKSEYEDFGTVEEPLGEQVHPAGEERVAAVGARLRSADIRFRPAPDALEERLRNPGTAPVRPETETMARTYPIASTLLALAIGYVSGRIIRRCT